MTIHARFHLSNRGAIEAEIERLIGILDTVDAPTEDLEPEEDFGPEDQPEAVGDHGRGVLPDLPRYAVDQSAGPINYKEADRAHYRRMMAG